jgi:hypothetical protein
MNSEEWYINPHALLKKIEMKKVEVNLKKVIKLKSNDKVENKDELVAKKKGGQPKKELTLEDATIVEALSAFLTCEQIADYFGINVDTFNEIRKRQPEILRAYKKGKAKAIMLMANNLVTKANEGDSACIMFYLKTQAGWREKQDINLSNEDGSLQSPKQLLVKYIDNERDNITKVDNSSKE